MSRKVLYDKAVKGLTEGQLSAAAASFVGRKIEDVNNIRTAVLEHAEIEGGLGGFLDEVSQIKHPKGCGCGPEGHAHA